MSRFFSIVLICAVFAVPARSVDATTVVRFEFDSLCERAETIAYVRCLSRTSYLDEDRGQVVTRTRFEVLAAVKGSPGAEIVLTLPGGKADGQRLYIPGMPEFGEDEEVVLFLTRPDSYGSPWPLGLGQGCYRARTVEGHEAQVTLQAGATPLPDNAFFKAASNRPFQVSLQKFLQQVRQAVASPPDKR